MALALPSLLILSFICPWTVWGLFSRVSTLPYFMNSPLTVFFPSYNNSEGCHLEGRA